MKITHIYFRKYLFFKKEKEKILKTIFFKRKIKHRKQFFCSHRGREICFQN